MFTNTLFLVASLLEAAETPAAAPRPADNGANDCRLTLRARQALFQDETLGRLNLGVSVRAEKGVLWGEVSSLELARRAETCVRQVAGILEVRNELRVVRPDDPAKEFLTRLPPKRSAPLPGRVSMLHRPAGALTSQGEDPGIALLPPIAVATPSKPDGALQSAVAKLQRADPRFHGLLPQIDGGVVRLRGTITRHEDLMELAQMISRIPGVERVILQDVKTPVER